MTKSEADLKDILCRVRSTDWEASVRRATDVWSDSSAGRGWYKDFMSKGDFTNVWSERLDEYLMRPVEWERMAFSSICTEIQTAPEDVRRWLQKLMDRYWMAAQALLRDVVPYERYLHVSTLTEVTVEDIPDFSDASRWGSFLGDSQSPEMDDVDEKAIVLRMLAIQELKKRLFTASGVQAEPSGEPVVDKPQVQEHIGWISTDDRLDRLADELQKERFVASAEAFAGQFKDAGGSPGEPCKWLKTDRSLVHLLEKLLNKRAIPGETHVVKTAIKHFRKKCGSEYKPSLTQNRSARKVGGGLFN